MTELGVSEEGDDSGEGMREVVREGGSSVCGKGGGTYLTLQNLCGVRCLGTGLGSASLNKV